MKNSTKYTESKAMKGLVTKTKTRTKVITQTKIYKVIKMTNIQKYIHT